MKIPKKLKPILYDEKLSAFNLSNKLDIFDTTLVLDDYDWLDELYPFIAYADQSLRGYKNRI